MSETSEAPPTTTVLMSISKHIAIRCSKVNKAYLACKKDHTDPTECLDKGDAVTGCVLDVLQDLNGRCPQQLKAYCECMDYYGSRFKKCRKEQKEFEEACPP